MDVARGVESRAVLEEIQAVWVQEIWRYPVKSMAGESLEAADLTEAGVVGDRVVQVRNAAGRIMTARTRPLLLRYRATLGRVEWRWQRVPERGWSKVVWKTDSTSCRFWSRPTECSRPLVTTDVAFGRIW